MKRRTASALLAAAALAGCGADRGQAERELREANARYDRAVIGGDSAALGELLADDYVYVSSEGEVRNKDQQIASLSAPQFDLRSPGSQDVTVRWIGDQALVIGRFPGEVHAGGNSLRFNERYSSLWTHDGGRWRIRHEHASLIPAHP
jgi:ketosteroid isomerase-like protein